MNNVNTCTVPAGSDNYIVTYNGPVLISNSNALSANVIGTVAQAIEGQSFGSEGGTDSNGNGTLGTQAFAVTINNKGAIGINTLNQPTTTPLAGIYAYALAGNGGPAASSNNNAAAGNNVTAPPVITNSGSIFINGFYPANGGGAALLAASVGGNSGNVPSSGTDSNGNPEYNGTASTGGQADGATVNNTGSITVGASGAVGYAGIAATGTGGNGGAGKTGGYGGGGGTVSVTNSGQVDVNWAWTATSTSDSGAFGILASSRGGDGSASYESQVDGGAGGAAQGANITVTRGGDVTLDSDTGYAGQTTYVISLTPYIPPVPVPQPDSFETVQSSSSVFDAASSGYDVITNTAVMGAGIEARLIGGVGGNGYDTGNGGVGGDAGTDGAKNLNINVTDANVNVSGGDDLAGIMAFARGGAGGTGGLGQDHSNGGSGGDTTLANINVTAATQPVTISTTGSNSPGIFADTLGGNGGNGTNYTCPFTCVSVDGGNGGAGGSAGGADVGLSGQVGITTQGSGSIGILANSEGGAGGIGGFLGGDLNTFSAAGNGGAGGAGGAVTVTFGGGGSSVTTTGDNADGVFARSSGGNGQPGGGVEVVGGNGAPGGAGGDSGDVTVTLDAGSSITTGNTTSGANSNGIAAQSLSGAGGNGGVASDDVSGAGGSGGAGGTTGKITVTNGGSITTYGASARGIIAQALSGQGGSGSSSNGIIYAAGGTGGSSGTVGDIDIEQDGIISTSGEGAQAVLAQSIAGGGGAAGDADGVVVSLGGSNSTNPLLADGGAIALNGSGMATTSGDYSIGELAQSIGGGGGDGGATTGAVGIGGSGGKGGAGGGVGGNISGSIETSGDESGALVLQSIGGGGGNGGVAQSATVGATVTIGGSGGGGGAGGADSLQGMDLILKTQGTKSPGAVEQSIGGGGGTGGAAYGFAVGPGFAAAVAVGGSGGMGGAGGNISAQFIDGLIATGQAAGLTTGSATSTNLLPVDDFGILMQSIGGGGGLGGSASAAALAVSVPIDEAGSTIAVAAAAAVGGAGGTGGAAGNVSLGLDDGQMVTTDGQGSDAVLAQSVGGGGGTGGDSSALAETIGYGMAGTSQLEDASSISLTATVTVGAAGGSAGAGGAVFLGLGGNPSNSGIFTPDAPGSAATSVSTFGDYADGIVAQSIGGGGGNAGFGASNTQSEGTGSDLTVAVGIGAQGGSGGAGGSVGVNLYPGDGVTTFGSGAVGVLAQSVGGGGGTSQGGSFNLGLPTTEDEDDGTDSLSGTVSLTLGGTSAAGNQGGDVTVNIDAPIVTHGGDATGVLAQSIGGGGGLAGSAGSDGAADNPVLSVTGVREFVTNEVSDDEDGESSNLSFTLNLGSKGGAGANGGTVDVSNASAIITSGDWADGIAAQSIGGGGGKAGTAAATGTGGAPGLAENVVGASEGAAGGGIGGNGGNVDVELNDGTIGTAGFAADGVIAQSIGGGGGIAADGSDAQRGAISVGISIGGSGGTGGGGGDVTLTADGATIVTTGEQAQGIVMQSIAGGGGIGGAGSSVAGNIAADNGTLILHAGGDIYSTGNSGTVSFQQAVVNIGTSGSNAYGILAQSIAGGGGIASAPSGSSTNATVGGGYSGGEGITSAGPVQILLSSGGQIITTGTGSDGIVAQSIGGGGGIAGFPGTAPIYALTNPTGTDVTGDSGGIISLSSGGQLSGSFGIVAQSINGGVIAALAEAAPTPDPSTEAEAEAEADVGIAAGNGGVVNVYTASPITVEGAGAIGILAQSIGGGGGISATGNTVYLGGTGAAGSTGTASQVTIVNNAAIAATGTGGIGILAQSENAGSTTRGGTISITAGGNVTGGLGGYAILTSGGNGNLISVAQGATVSALSGNAVQAYGAATDIDNAGVVTGQVNLNGGTLYNEGSGVANAGATMDANIVNAGLFAVNGREVAPNPLAPGAFAATTVAGSFIQQPGGIIQVGGDFNTGTADVLVIQGADQLDGQIKVLASSVLPNIHIPVLIAEDGVSGAITGAPSALYAYDTDVLGDTVRVSARATGFAPAGLGVTGNGRAVAANLLGVFNTATSPQLGSLFGALGQLADAGGSAYASTLSSLSPGSVLGFAASRLADTVDFGDSLMGCPTSSDKGATVTTTDDGCAWFKTQGRTLHQDSDEGYAGYTIDSVSYRIGAQADFAPGWFVGGALGYEQDWLNGSDTGRGHGDTGYAGIDIGRELGQFRIIGAAFGSFGDYNASRNSTVPGFTGLLSSRPAIDSQDIRLRVDYTAPLGDFYLRPSFTLDGVRVHSASMQETGQSVTALDYEGATQLSVVATPLVELGTERAVGPATTLRGYVTAGVGIPSETRFQQNVRFQSADASAGDFTATGPMAGTTGRIGVGLQLLAGKNADLKATFEEDVAGLSDSQVGALEAAWRF